ncbi:Exonuclease 3'-5' domain-containing protein 2 [Sesamum angolense]|uniref:Exonuclease 3'-5' domain-containing protein 2 n=1 Tax=Sesamum angolense TaxID=2727404 RepID=A0AAE1X7S5_9LAMI|nr:Exonuclease 3'-5' domain-containing protein 2 [Sesamum angolense]
MASNKYMVSFSGTRIETTVTDKAAVVTNWVQEVLSMYGGQSMIVGLDCEWKPNSYAFENNKTATLQLCVDTKCLILQLFYLDFIPQSLKNFMVHPSVTFVGVGVQDELQQEYGLVCSASAMKDIQEMAMARHPLEFIRRPGLKDLASWFVGLNMSKPIHVCRSNWEARNLSLDQIEYACIDAYASYRIGRKLLNGR